jgi:hypothetical protein
MRNFPGSDFDLSGMDASPDEIGMVLDTVAEVDAEMEAGTYNGYDADAEAAAQWAASLTDAEMDELLAEYEADQALPPGPELAGADVGGTVDLANDMSAIDAMLSAMTNKEHERQVQDQAEAGRRRGSTEIRLSRAMERISSQTYLYGQADLAADPGIDALFSTGPSLNAAEVADRMRYELQGGAKPQGRGRFLPPVAGLARQIGLR